MGVPKFYRWISERYPCLSEVIQDEQIPEFDNLYLDMNGIIHGCSHPDDEDVSFRISEEQIFRDIFNYIDFLFGIIKPKKLFFLAVDGVAPRAKMNQQRARRFMSAKNTREALKKAKKKGIEIPNEKPFDSNCITPGTHFMARLHEHLQYFLQMKITTDSCWQGLRIYLSGHNCPGEGEHKIMDFIRSERSRSDYDANTRHCLYGLDADLIMLGMCSHEPHFALLREEVKFGRPKNRSGKHRSGVEGITFHLLHLSLLREYLSWEFHSLKEKLSFDYNLESIIDDWVLMGFLVGNDFIPHLPHVHIHEDALPLLYATYNEVLPQLDGYINEAGVLNLKRFEIFLKSFAKNDKKNFIEQMDDEAYLASKRTAIPWRGITSQNDEENCDKDLRSFAVSKIENNEITGNDAHKGAFDSDSDTSDNCTDDPKILTATKALCHGYFGLNKDSDDDLPDVLLDNESYENDCNLSWNSVVSRAFRNHKRDYYNDKMMYKNISKEELREQAEGYIRAIQWNLHYYYHGCCSWSWFYPHHYAPYISDISDFTEMEMNFDLNEPFKPFEQLLAVLPSASADCLPPPYQELMLDPKSPIIDFYPEEFDTDLNGKKNDWEAVVLIPFIKEDRLLQAMATKKALLNDERNVHGPHLLFSYDPSSPHILKSTYPGIFPDIQKCTAKVEKLEMNQFRLPRSHIIHGLLPGVKLDVVFPGFPTMKHIPHIAELHFADIKVFQQPSKKQSMILKIVDRPEFGKDMLEIAFDLVGAEVHVNWPMLQKALVQELWTSNKKYSKSIDEEIICKDLSKEEQETYKSYTAIARRNEFERRGIEAGEQKGLALVRAVQGSRKCFEGQQVVTKRSYTNSDNAVPVSLSLVVQNALEDWDSVCSFEDVFPINANVFISSVESKYYGFCGFIKENHLAMKGTLTVSCRIPPMANVNFCDVVANYDKYSLKWYSTHEVASFLRTTADVVSRITGCVYASLDESDSVSSKFVPANKVNIGLELKFSKRNQIMPDFTRRSSDGHWLYSSKAFEMIRNYRTRYPGVFRYLEKLDNFLGYILVKQIFPEFKGKELHAKFEELKRFLCAVTGKDTLESADGVFVDSAIVKEIEKRTQQAVSGDTAKEIYKRLAVKPRAIFMAELCKGNFVPDPKAEFRLLDRVVCVKKLHAAPFGEFGTVIGLLNTPSGKKVDVLFDKPYFGGRIMRDSKASGARLSISSLINITHGKRMRKEIGQVSKTVTTNHEPADFQRNVCFNKEYSFSGFQQKIPFGTSGIVPRNKLSTAEAGARTTRSEWSLQSLCPNDSLPGNDFRFRTGEYSSSVVTHGGEIRGKDTAAFSEKRKSQAKPSHIFVSNSCSSGYQVPKGEEKTFGGKRNTNIVPYSEKIKHSFDQKTNFGKVEANNNKKRKSGGVREISSCDNRHQERNSPGKVFGLQSELQTSVFNISPFDELPQKQGGIWNTYYERTGLSSVGNITSPQLDFDKNVSSQFAENLMMHDGDGEIKNNQKSHSRTWFGRRSAKPKQNQYFLCDFEGTAEQSSSRPNRIGKRILEKNKSAATTSSVPTALLKKKGFRDEGIVESSVVERSEKFAVMESANEKQEVAPSRGDNEVGRLIEELSKQRLDLSGESSDTGKLPATCLLPESLISKETILRKPKYKTHESLVVFGDAEATTHDMEAVSGHNSYTELNFYDGNCSAVSTPNSTSPCLSGIPKRRPRKSRVAANLGFKNKQLGEE
uniref:5'-3' exoribonuclease 1 n=1 Tax=Setaria digitata TaxID=48799 RepID=A0A915PML3_9BILA